MKEKLTYEAAKSELTAISKEIESASELIEFCQARLQNTEAEVNKIISRMENPEH
jgi:exodeoxyribonuclease VII small subunit